MRITVWNEFEHEKCDETVRAIYPDGIHGCIAAFLREAGFDVTTATLDMPEHGLTEEVLNNTDVLFWWGHMAHHKVSDEIVQRVYNHIMRGMGFVALHSAHASKIFEKLMGTPSGCLKWRESGDTEIMWVTSPNHPIVEGIGDRIVIPQEETYGEHFNIPEPDELVFVSWFSGGEVFRSGCCFKRGMGRIFYFKPGHESFPIYHQKDVQKVLINAARWACPTDRTPIPYGHFPVKPIDEINAGRSEQA